MRSLKLLMGLWFPFFEVFVLFFLALMLEMALHA